MGFSLIRFKSVDEKCFLLSQIRFYLPINFITVWFHVRLRLSRTWRMHHHQIIAQIAIQEYSGTEVPAWAALLLQAQRKPKERNWARARPIQEMTSESTCNLHALFLTELDNLSIKPWKYALYYTWWAFNFTLINFSGLNAMNFTKKALFIFSFT